MTEKTLARWQEWRQAVELLSMQNPDTLFIGGPSEKKALCLTFDDGPDNRNTPKVLDILQKEQVRATFFFLGNNSEQYRKIVKQTYDAGHVIGSHSFDHPYLTKKTEPQLTEQVHKTEQSMFEIIGKRPTLLRPPYGDINASVLNVLNKNGYKAVLWSLDTFDWNQKTSTEIVDYVSSNVHPGDIILMHSADNGSASVKALPAIIAALKHAGYSFCTVDEMLGITPYH
ncbi:polysaccharide deacetylase family protein [Heliobacterium chlorum]|nr:polysaccharide deacetylase family protein [Heliobacterium chlorum]